MRRDTARLRDTAFDILIVGAGMHGAWIARRAAEAGHRVALVERDDFAAATSANSLNILHGGLRYLQHFDLARMRSSIRARREFSRQSPHLVQALPCVMPLGPMGVRSPWILGPALLLNDLFSADRNAGVAGPARLPNGRLIGSADCREQVAPLADTGAGSGALWWDALSLDSARLCLETVLAAADSGAVVANRVEVLRLLLSGGAIQGIAACDRLSGVEFEIRAAVVIDATGPASGRLAAASDLPAPYLPRSWLGALNLVFRSALPLKAAVALSSASKTADRSVLLRRATRDLFFVPWHGAIAVGTDYVPLDSPAAGSTGPPAGVVQAFIAEIGRVAPKSRLRAADLVAVNWGILPGIGTGAATPSKSPILASGRLETGADGLVVVVGEKLTSAPSLSQAVLARAEQAGNLRRSSGRQALAQARALRPTSSDEARGFGLEAEPRKRLEKRYGLRWRQIFEPYLSQGELFRPVLAGSEVLAVEVVHAVREEMALDLDDLLLRRLGLARTGWPSVDLARRCAGIAGPELGWSADAQAAAIAAFEAKMAAGDFVPDPVRL
ncbi:MAG: FAD-dependent oxidoreductase [Steroidobacteraceae bacterium]